MATSGGRIIVGADLDDLQGEESGAAYVYRLSDGVWRLESKMKTTVEPGTGDHRDYECGYSVDISNDGTSVVVGCPGALGGGVAYTFNLDESGRWMQTAKLNAPAGSSRVGLRLGSSVALSAGENDIVVVGDGEVFSYSKDC